MDDENIVDKNKEIKLLLEKHNLIKEDIISRMTGCPNGCGRSTVAEIGFIGTTLSKYNMHLGSDNQVLRLNKIYKESVDEATILIELEELFVFFTKEKNSHETFGNFALRKIMVEKVIKK